MKELAAIKIPHCDTRDANGACTKTTRVGRREGARRGGEGHRRSRRRTRASRSERRRRRRRATTARRTRRSRRSTSSSTRSKASTARFARARGEEPGRRPPRHRGAARARRWSISSSPSRAPARPRSSRIRSIEKMLPSSSRRHPLAARRALPGPAQDCTWAKQRPPEQDARRRHRSDVRDGRSMSLDAIRADEPARTELERLLVFLLQSAQADASKTTLTALVDLLQVFEDDANVTALLRSRRRAPRHPRCSTRTAASSRAGSCSPPIEVMSRVLGEARDTTGGTRLCSQGGRSEPHARGRAPQARHAGPPTDSRRRSRCSSTSSPT